MTDLIERLRDPLARDVEKPQELFREAADEIERLRADLKLTHESALEYRAEIERLCEVVRAATRFADERRADLAELNAAIGNAIGAIADTRTVRIPDVPSELAESIRALTAERDEAVEALRPFAIANPGPCPTGRADCSCCAAARIVAKYKP